MERDAVSRANGSFIHISIKELSHTTGKHMVTIHRAHMDRRPKYIGVRPGSPRGLYDTSVTTPLSCSMIPATLASVNQSPVNWHVS
jgi:hypothetical protein